jgi:hypothetical protein
MLTREVLVHLLHFRDELGARGGQLGKLEVLGAECSDVYLQKKRLVGEFCEFLKVSAYTR